MWDDNYNALLSDPTFRAWRDQNIESLRFAIEIEPTNDDLTEWRGTVYELNPITDRLILDANHRPVTVTLRIRTTPARAEWLW